MNEQNVKSSSPSPSPKRSGWGKKLLMIFGVLVVLFVVLFFVVTSGAFIKGVILPKVGAVMNSDVTVSDVSLSPFSQLELHNLKVTPKGKETLLTASLVRARYHLFAIISGNILVDEVTVESPVVTIVTEADGSSNLDPITKSSSSKPASTPTTSSSKPPVIDIKSVSLKNATVHQTTNLKGGGHQTIDLSNVNFTAGDLKNGGTGKLDISAAISMDQTGSTNAGSMQAKVNGAFTFDLTPDLKPGKINGKLTFATDKADGLYAQLATLAADFECEATPTEIKQMALRFTQSGQALGELRVSGPFDANKTEGKLTVAILSIDKRVLNLAGAASGLDFGTSVINSTNTIELTKGGSAINVSGQLDASHIRVTTREKQTTPTLDLHSAYVVSVDNAAKSALLQKLDISGQQDGKPFLQGGLSSPMSVSFGGTAASAGDAAFNLTVTDLSLETWRAFAADLAPAGMMNLKLKVLSEQGGKSLTFDVDSGITGLAAKVNGQSISGVDVNVKTHGTQAGKQVKFDSYALEVKQAGQSALTVNGSGTVDTATQDADLQLAVQAVLARLVAIVPQPGLTIDSGTLDFKGHVAKKQQDQSVTAKMTLADFSGKSGNNKFDKLAATVDIDAGAKGQQFEVRTGLLTLAATERAKNEIRLTGTVDMTKPSAISGNLKLASDAVDVTHFYDVMEGNTNAAPAPVAKAQAPASDSNKEPDAVKLPIGNFTFEVSVGHFYLREVDAANFQLVTKIDGSHVVVKPAKLTLNQAPIDGTVDLDLGVPGYKYDIAFSADKIPLAPLVNSFAPDRKGQLSGVTTASGQFKGAGITGTSLQKNLTGKFDFLSTNMNLAITNVHTPMIKSVINTVMLLPDLLRNPTAVLGNILGGKSSSANPQQASFGDQLAATPIDMMQMNAQAGSGKITLQQAQVQSKALQILAKGDVTIAPILTNSPIQIPVSVTLNRGMAEKIGLVTKETPTNAIYVALPDFLTLKGTAGKPATDINKTTLMAFAAKSLTGVSLPTAGSGTNAVEKASSLLNAAESLFGGKKSQTPAPAPAKPAAPVKKP